MLALKVFDKNKNKKLPREVLKEILRHLSICPKDTSETSNQLIPTRKWATIWWPLALVKCWIHRINPGSGTVEHGVWCRIGPLREAWLGANSSNGLRRPPRAGSRKQSMGPTTRPSRPFASWGVCLWWCGDWQRNLLNSYKKLHKSVSYSDKANLCRLKQPSPKARSANRYIRIDGQRNMKRKAEMKCHSYCSVLRVRIGGTDLKRRAKTHNTSDVCLRPVKTLAGLQIRSTLATL